MYDIFPREVGFPKRVLVRSREEMMDLINKYNGGKHCYVTVYGFREANHLRATYPTAVVDKVFFDLDGEGALDDAIKLTLDAIDDGIKHVNFFSGRKGFHHYRWCTEPVNKKNALRSYVAHVEEKLDLKSNDFHIKGDLSQMARVPFTVHLKSGLYCVPVTLDDLYAGKDHVLKLARTPSGKITVIGKKLVDLSSWDKNYPDMEPLSMAGSDTASFKDLILPPCIERSILGTDNPVHWARWMMTVYLLYTGQLTPCGIKDLIKKLHGMGHWRDYNSRVTDDQLKSIVGNYVVPSCRTVRMHGLCTDCFLDLDSKLDEYYQWKLLSKKA
nr:MAG: prim-pol domain superfamily protein [Helarchaeota virus Nidhogg Meg22_1214]